MYKFKNPQKLTFVCGITNNFFPKPVILFLKLCNYFSLLNMQEAKPSAEITRVNERNFSKVYTLFFS